jgi:integrase/recombinase XerD
VIINGRRAEIILKRECAIDSWDERAHRIKGRNPDATRLNGYLDAKYSRLLQCYEDLLKEDLLITAKTINAKFQGIDEKAKGLSEIIEYHKINMGEVLKPGTLKNYTATEKYLSDYLLKDWKTSDIYLKNTSYQFVTGFDGFLRRGKGN